MVQKRFTVDRFKKKWKKWLCEMLTMAHVDIAWHSTFPYLHPSSRSLFKLSLKIFIYVNSI